MNAWIMRKFAAKRLSLWKIMIQLDSLFIFSVFKPLFGHFASRFLLMRILNILLKGLMNNEKIYFKRNRQWTKNVHDWKLLQIEQNMFLLEQIIWPRKMFRIVCMVYFSRTIWWFSFPEIYSVFGFFSGFFRN